MKKETIDVKRILAAIIVLFVMFVGIFVLTRPCTGVMETKTEIPAIGSSPIYVEMTDGEKLTRQYIAKNDTHVSSLELLLVNTTESSDAKLLINVLNEQGEMLFTEEEKVADFVVGDWTDVCADFWMNAGETYTYEFVPSNCSPFFMQVEGYDLDISLGFDYVTDRTVTYGDVFYYSIPIMIAVCLLLAALLLFGSDRMLAAWNKLDLINWIRRFGAEAFLVILFVTLSLKIYATAYVDGVYITSDSNGYLREAVNLVAGNGYSYDGIAGYNSWFANWPIIYPAMIALMMLITGANAYLASKFVAILCIAVIEIILYVAFKKDAWLYALALTNVGVLNMAYNTWSEIPFMVFMLLFGIMLGKIVSEDEAPVWVYAALSLSGTATYLTRYFGIFVWVVAGLYWFIILLNWWNSASDKKGLKEHIADGDKRLFKKLISLAISAAASGFVYIAYLMMNKIMNGNPTGVSRGTWWDDYKSLTDDLVKSLVAEIFNVFSVDVPKAISDKPAFLQVWFVIIVSVLVGILIHRCLKGRGGVLARYMSAECVFVVMALVYYGMFIVIRYRSSMDTFYFRFFAPATFLLVIGLIGLALKTFDMKKISGYFGTFVTVLILASFVELCGGCDFTHARDYYDITVNSWNSAYGEIPQKSVVIWSDVDYRSLWYRADIVEGELYGDDTPDTLSERYYGSQYLCIRRDYAETIMTEGEYAESLKAMIQSALDSSDVAATYINVKLR